VTLWRLNGEREHGVQKRGVTCGPSNREHWWRELFYLWKAKEQKKQIRITYSVEGGRERRSIQGLTVYSKPEHSPKADEEKKKKGRKEPPSWGKEQDETLEEPTISFQ